MGIKAAKGEYIAYVDSDDWIDNDFIEKLYLAAKLNGADIATCNMKWFYDHSHKPVQDSWITRIFDRIGPDIVSSVEHKKLIIGTSAIWNKLFNREFLLRHHFLFYEGLYWEDNPYTVMTTIKANKICLVRDVVYYYRKHSSSITGTAKLDRKPFDIFKIMLKLKIFFDVENIEIQEGYQNYFYELCYIYYIDLFEVVHVKYKREFFKQFKSEFQQIDEASLGYLCRKYSTLNLLMTNNYISFLVKYYLIIKLYQFTAPRYEKIIISIKKIRHYM